MTTTRRPPRLVPAGPPVEVDYDLDAARVARASTRPPKTFRIGGHEFVAPNSMPIYVGVLLREGKQREALQAWLGAEQEATFATCGVDDDDVGDLFRELYGLGSAGGK